MQNIAFTAEPLIQGNEFKINRKRLEKVKLIEETEGEGEKIDQNATVLRIKELFAQALGKEIDQIPEKAHFFFDLKGNSLDYFSLVSSVQAEFGVKFPQEEGRSLYTVAEFYEFIQKNI